VKIHEKYMLRCIQLAKNGLGTTYPNPLVGSVLVHNKKVIGEGWHRKAGQPHAEVLAIASVGDKSILTESTIYVNLEPCSHFGKTPPCADLIISKGIKKVVIGTTDPNPKVAGRGIKKLLDAGCDVVVGVLEKECADLNKRFFTFQQKQRPFIILKWAQTTDGFIAPLTKNEQQPIWITNTYARQISHKMRAEAQGILVGTQTVVDDNPSLTTRDWYGPSPTRLIIDRTLRSDGHSAVYDGSTPTYIFTEAESKDSENCEFIKIDFSNAVARQISEIAYLKGLQSIIIEGGAKTIATFVAENCWDEAYIFEGPKKFQKGIKAPELQGALLSVQNIGSDTLFHYKNQTI